MNILFIAKHKPFSEEAAALVHSNMDNAKIVYGEVGDPFPPALIEEKFNYLISYISPWIIPKQVLDNINIAAINFHPGPPEYPGIGCTNFAIYNGEKEFGITVHHMAEKVDAGDIIMVKRFPLFENDTVFSLTQRCYIYIYTAFIDVLNIIVSDGLLPESSEYWRREPYKRSELDALCAIKTDMSNEEIERRIRATSYPQMPGAFIELAGYKFRYESEQ